MKTIAIVGVGLIGGSFALAVRKHGWEGTILGVSSARTIAEALRLGVIDEGVTLEEAAARADLIYLAQPISVILDTIDRLAPIARNDCLITDAGSTKAEIVRRGSKLPMFLGGHPLAGKEATGVQAADASLFADRTYVLTPTYEAPLQGAFISLIEHIGAVPVCLDSEKHDRIVAYTSHLPQIAATALATALDSKLLERNEFEISGPGLQDMTRLAMSSWDVWKDIVSTNTANLQHALSVYIDKLTELRQNLGNQCLGVEFAAASEAAGKIRRLGDRPRQRGDDLASNGISECNQRGTPGD